MASDVDCTIKHSYPLIVCRMTQRQKPVWFSSGQDRRLPGHSRNLSTELRARKPGGCLYERRMRPKSNCAQISQDLDWWNWIELQVPAVSSKKAFRTLRGRTRSISQHSWRSGQSSCGKLNRDMQDRQRGGAQTRRVALAVSGGVGGFVRRSILR